MKTVFIRVAIVIAFPIAILVEIFKWKLPEAIKDVRRDFKSLWNNKI
jgi:hypothetical protein